MHKVFACDRYILDTLKRRFQNPLWKSGPTVIPLMAGGRLLTAFAVRFLAPFFRAAIRAMWRHRILPDRMVQREISSGQPAQKFRCMSQD
jgi:hypothetical protein